MVPSVSPLEVQVIGCGDAFGSGGRFNTCFLVHGAGYSVAIDCGASSLIALKSAGKSPDEIDAIAISHLHGNHFGGLVFLLREATLYGKRTRPLTIAGPPGIEQRLERAMEVFFPSGWVKPETFALSIIELQDRQRCTIGPTAVTAFPAEHYSGAPSYSIRLEAFQRVVTYSGDTLWTSNLEEAADGADLFICECYSYDKPRGTHIDFKTLDERAHGLNCRHILLTHLGPDMLERLDQVSKLFDVASDGQVLAL